MYLCILYDSHNKHIIFFNTCIWNDGNQCFLRGRNWTFIYATHIKIVIQRSQEIFRSASWPDASRVLVSTYTSFGRKLRNEITREKQREIESLIKIPRRRDGIGSGCWSANSRAACSAHALDTLQAWSLYPIELARVRLPRPRRQHAIPCVSCSWILYARCRRRRNISESQTKMFQFM